MMPDLHAVATRHGLPPDAVRHLLEALVRGHGTMAQFDHSALGGMGQWRAGGLIMIGDMFNGALKAKVASLCADLAPFAVEASAAARPSGGWWPHDLGEPSSSGSQDGVRYAVFPQARRVAIEREGRVTLHDTADRRIDGVSQRQGGERDLAFSSDAGSVRVRDLLPVDMPGGAPPRARETEPSGPSDESRAPVGPDLLGMIEGLAALHRKGVLTEAEFTAKKAELLARL